MRVLFVVPYAPTRIRTRPFHLIRALRSAGHDVTVATLWTSEEERAALTELATGATDLLAERLSVARSLWNCLRALPRSEPLQAHFSWSPTLAARLAKAVTELPFDVVHVEHLRGVRYGLWLGDMLATRAGRPAMIWDSVDCISALFRRASRESDARRVRLAARLELPRTERYEASMITRFDRVIVTAERDRQQLLDLMPAARQAASASRVEVVPNGVDLEYFAPAPEPREPMTLVISGKMSYHANATAVSRFVREAMPAVWKELPGVRLWVVGKDPTAEVLALGEPWPSPFAHRGEKEKRSRVLITGTVDDIRPFLRRASLAVAPIQYGVGIQNKVLEAMACGTPVVATPQAVDGVGARPAEDVIVASNPVQMAKSIVALLRDPSRCVGLGRAGRAYVERRHGWPSVAARLADIYACARAS